MSQLGQMQPYSLDLTGDQWCAVNRWEYTPPCDLIVWTTDGTAVRQAQWHYEPPAPLEEGCWTDSEGNPITVTHWLYADEDLEEPPAPPRQ